MCCVVTVLTLYRNRIEQVRSAALSHPEHGCRQIWRHPCGALYNVKIEIHSSCEAGDFVETHLYKLCVILRSPVLLGLCHH